METMKMVAFGSSWIVNVLTILKTLKTTLSFCKNGWFSKVSGSSSCLPFWKYWKPHLSFSKTDPFSKIFLNTIFGFVL